MRAGNQRPVELRDGLGAHDRTLLELIEPLMRVPQDEPTLNERLSQITSSRDPDFLFFACRVFVDRGNYARAVEMCRAASELDARLGAARRMEALALVSLGDEDGGLHAYEECVRLSPNATSCLIDLFTIDLNEGRCTEAVTLARRLLALEPDSAESYDRLASALLGAGESSESYREAVRQQGERMPDDYRRAIVETSRSPRDAARDRKGERASRAARQLLRHEPRDCPLARVLCNPVPLGRRATARV